MVKVVNGLICGFLIVVILFFVLLRLTDLSSNPPGFFVDESSTAFNAFSVLTTGADEHGAFLPVFFKAFGEFKNPIYIYSQIPFEAVFGLSREAARATSAVWGILTIAVFVLLLRIMRLRLPAVLLAAAVFLASPWHLILSRISFEVVTYPFFLVLAMIFLWLFQEKAKFKWFLYFGLCLGVSFYSYTSARFLSPALLILAVSLYRKKLPVKQIILSFAIFLVCLLPAIFWEGNHPGSLMARFEVVGLSHYVKSYPEFGEKFLTQYFSHFSTDFLFNKGDGNLRHSLVWHSVFLWSTIPFLVAGGLAIIKKPGKFVLWVIWGLFLAIIPSALTIQSPHPLRAIGMLPFLMIVLALGANYFLEKKRLFFLWAFLVMLFVIEVFGEVKYFQNEYRENSEVWFDKETYEFLEREVNANRPVVISDKFYPGTFETVRFLEKSRKF